MRPCTRPTAAAEISSCQDAVALLGGGEVGVLAFLDHRADPIDLGAALQRPRDRRRSPRRGGRAASCGYRSAAAPAASRSGARCRGRRRPSSSRCAGSASRSSAACRRRCPFRASARRCSTPKRCCSSITASARSRKATSVWISACVPTTIGMSPLGEPGEHRLARPALLAPGQQPDLDPGRRGEALQDRVVLARQHLGRRHQRRLRAGSRPRSASPAARRRSCRCRHRPAAAASSGAAPSCRRRSRRAPGAGSASARSRTRPRPAPASAPVPLASARPRRASPAPAPAPPRAGSRGSRHRRAARARGVAGDRSASLCRRVHGGDRLVPARPVRAAPATPGRAIPAAPGARSSAVATARCDDARRQAGGQRIDRLDRLDPRRPRPAATT